MKLSAVIAYVDAVKPNKFDAATQVIWLNEVEGMVQTDVMLIAPADVKAYSAETDMDTVMLVMPPHDKLYRTYLCAMVDFANGEIDKYKNSMQLFNNQYAEYTEWYCRTGGSGS